MAIRDSNLVLQASTTITATTNSTGVDLKGTPRRGLKAQINYTAAANASGSNTVTFSVEHSDDNSTYYAMSSGAADVITLSTTAQAGEQFIPFETSKRYVRLVSTVAGAGTSPTITRQGAIVLSRP
jgi:hypothetical protein